MRNEKGLTLVEVLVVFALVSVMSVAVGITLSTTTTLFKLRSAGDEIRGLLQLGRELAETRKDQATYSITYDTQSVVLKSSTGAEMGRYQPPSGMTTTPAIFSWGFAPVTGLLTGCVLPCSLTLNLNGESELVTISTNGLVN